MFLRTLAVAALITSVGCSSGGSDNATPEPNPNPNPNPNPTPNPIPNPIPEPTPNPGTPGATTGVWLGPTTFGGSVFVIDNGENLFGLSSDNTGQHETIFGNVAGTSDLEVFAHRDSDDLTIGDSFTVVGDPQPSRAYSLTVTNDGQSLVNTGEAGEFSLTLADANDLPALAVADVVGDWESRTGIDDGAGGANELVVSMTFSADGMVTGSTTFAAFDPVPLNGTVTSAGQYLSLNFLWNGLTRNGVVYLEPATGRLIVNTFGFESTEEGNRSFSANLVRQ